MKKVLLALMVAVLLLVSLAPIAMAAHGRFPDKDAIKAIEKYRKVDEALADGYIPASPCIAAPPGGMGIHYVNFGLVDPFVDPLTPEILLYVPKGNKMKLVGVEYMAVYVGQPAPILFGETMNGPMPGHGPGEPDHYDLHVWMFKKNPSGMFADFNPKVHCP